MSEAVQVLKRWAEDGRDAARALRNRWVTEFSHLEIADMEISYREGQCAAYKTMLDAIRLVEHTEHAADQLFVELAERMTGDNDE